MSKRTTFRDICWIITAVSYLNAGHSVKAVAEASHTSVSTVRRRLAAAGFWRNRAGKWVNN